MSVFLPIAPIKAVEFVEAAGISDGRRIIADFAAAGLLKSYALMIETVHPSGDRAEVRGGAIPTHLWQRIVREGAVEDVWAGGTVRLATGSAEGGALEVNVTGIGFGEKQLQRIVAQHRGASAPQQPKTPANMTRAAEPEEIAPVEAIIPSRASRKAEAPVQIDAAPILVTVKQAMAMLGLGRTKVNELMKSGRLVRRHIDGGVRIEVASVHTLAAGRTLAELNTA